MTESHSPPSPVIKRMRWPFPLVWIVPLLAVAGSGYYWSVHTREEGIEISIKFDDVEGIRLNDSLIKYRGVTIGKVVGMALADNLGKAVIRARLNRDAKAMARDGAGFWIVKADFSAGELTGLGTVVSGPYIQAAPGEGTEKHDFVAWPMAPVGIGEKGIDIMLLAHHSKSVEGGTPVYYKGVQIGQVRTAELTSDATAIQVNVLIWDRFKLLVRTNSVFWNVSGADFKGGLFTGVEFRVNSLKSLIAGGIAMATPNEGIGEPVIEGTKFELHPEAEKDWRDWSPKISIGEK